MKRVVMACFWVNETNSGDKSYVETILRLLDKYRQTIQVDICDFYARVPSAASGDEGSAPKSFAGKVKRALVKSPLYPLLRKLKAALPKKKEYGKIKEYYRKKLENADALLIPGGGLVEYSSWRDYYILMEMLESICEERNIPIFINSIGYVENEDPEKWLQRWQKVLNHPRVIHATCRDNLPFFQKLCPQITQVPCAACLSSEVFPIVKDENSCTVGIGMMRPDAYDDYGNRVTTEFLLDYYKQIVEELIRRGYKVALFSVGVVRDQAFGEALHRYLNREDVLLLERPKTVEAFLKQVASFRGILTVRTHSAYAAFSLNVPAVMVYFGKRGWSGKSREFMKMMGTPENAIACDELTPADLVSRFEEAMRKGWPAELREERRKQCYDNFLEIVEKIDALP